MNEKIIKICEQKLIYLNYSERTIENYIPHIKKFLESLGNKQVIHCNSKDFQSYLDSYKFSSVSQQNQVINAIRFLYKFCLEKKYDKVSFKRPKGEKKLPQIINNDFLLERLSKVENLKHKLILALPISVGLRVSEIINLKLKDIDFEDNVIYIRNAKGRKDRIVPLSSTIKSLVGEYLGKYSVVDYLFVGQNGGRYSDRSCNQLVKKHFGEKYHFHTLRHSCLTGLAERQVNLSVIQKMAGHANPKTTSLYIHLSRNAFDGVPLTI